MVNIDFLFFFFLFVVGTERSARSTFPDLINFRMGKLSGFRRVFAHVAPIFFERGIAKPETKVFLLHFFLVCLRWRKDKDKEKKICIF